MHLWSYPSKYWNCCSFFNIKIGILISSFQTLEFWPFFHTHWFWDLIIWNCWILALFVKALELLSYPFKHWNSRPIFVKIGIPFSSFQTLEFWSDPFKRWNSCPLFINLGILASFWYTLVFWSYLSKHWNFDPIYNDGNYDLMLRLMGFYGDSHKHRNSDLILPKIGVLVLFL